MISQETKGLLDILPGEDPSYCDITWKVLAFLEEVRKVEGKITTAGQRAFLSSLKIVCKQELAPKPQILIEHSTGDYSDKSVDQLLFNSIQTFMKNTPDYYLM